MMVSDTILTYGFWIRVLYTVILTQIKIILEHAHKIYIHPLPPRADGKAGAIYLTVAMQEALPFATRRLLRWNHFGRKNLAFLYAIQHGARYVASIGDTYIGTYGTDLEAAVAYARAEAGEATGAAADAMVVEAEDVEDDGRLELDGRRAGDGDGAGRD